MATVLNSAKEADKHLKDAGPTMIIYFAEWCGHCQSMKSTWDEVARKVEGKAKVYKIESANYPKVTSFPKAVIVRKGRVIETLNGGGQSVEDLTKKLLSFGGKRTRRFRPRRLVRRTRKTH